MRHNLENRISLSDDNKLTRTDMLWFSATTFYTMNFLEVNPKGISRFFVFLQLFISFVLHAIIIGEVSFIK